MPLETDERGHFKPIHGKATTRAYKSWWHMWSRCTNPKDDGFKHYGARGITVADAWKEFEIFYRDMGDPPDGFEIERMNNDRPYCKENCRWASHTEQCNNRRSTRLLTLHGRSQSLALWAREYGADPRLVWKRLRRGWDVERSLTAPSAAKKG